MAVHSYSPFIHKEAKETGIMVSVILEHVSAEAIFLLGSSITQTKTTSIFCNEARAASFTSHYYLLVIIEKEEEYTLNAVQDKIENNLQHFIPATAIVLSKSAFVAWMDKAHPFAVNVVCKAGRLYEREHIFSSTIIEAQEDDQSLCKQARHTTKGFLASAELHRLRQEYKLSAFMLHQALEQALRAMLMMTG